MFYFEFKGTSLQRSVRPLGLALIFLFFVVILFSSLLEYSEVIFHDIITQVLPPGEEPRYTSVNSRYISHLDPVKFTLPTTFDTSFAYAFITSVCVDVEDRFHLVVGSPEGEMLMLLLSFLGVLFVAMPLAIIGQNFAQVWHDRHQLLLQKKTAERFYANGLTKFDLRTVFKEVDSDNSGAVHYTEFRVLVDSFNLGLSPGDIRLLFRMLNISNTGELTFREFVIGLFPGIDVDALEKMDGEDDTGRSNLVNFLDGERPTDFGEGTGRTAMIEQKVEEFFFLR